MRRKITDETQARRCLEAADRAGLAPGAWAREHGIDGRSLNAWRINLSRSKPRTRDRRQHRHKLPRLVELIPSTVRRPDARYLVRVGGLTVEVPDDFDESVLLRLIRALRSC